MLEKLRLRNFQIHEDREIIFDEKVTTIIGPTDAGKSAIMRSLKWLVENKPAGDAFRRDGSKVVKVGLKFDGRMLMRTKSASVNKMTLDKEPFEAFGKCDVPDEISQALNIHPLSFQDQHDSPYWLSDTAGQVSRQLNAIVNLDVIDVTMKNITSMLRKAKGEEAASVSRKKQAVEEVEKYGFVEDLQEDFEEVTTLEEGIAEKAARLARIEKLLEKASQYLKAAKTASEALRDASRTIIKGETAARKIEQLQKLEKLVLEAEEASVLAGMELPTKGEMAKVEDLHGEFWESRAAQTRLEEFIEQAEKKQEWVDSLAFPSVAEIESVQVWGREYESERKFAEGLEEAAMKAEAMRSFWVEKDQAVIVAKRELEEKLEGQCPLCGGEWNAAE